MAATGLPAECRLMHEVKGQPWQRQHRKPDRRKASRSTGAPSVNDGVIARHAFEFMRPRPRARPHLGDWLQAEQELRSPTPGDAAAALSQSAYTRSRTVAMPCDTDTSMHRRSAPSAQLRRRRRDQARAARPSGWPWLSRLRAVDVRGIVRRPAAGRPPGPGGERFVQLGGVDLRERDAVPRERRSVSPAGPMP